MMDSRDDGRQSWDFLLKFLSLNFWDNVIGVLYFLRYIHYYGIMKLDNVFGAIIFWINYARLNIEVLKNSFSRYDKSLKLLVFVTNCVTLTSKHYSVDWWLYGGEVIDSNEVCKEQVQLGLHGHHRCWSRN